MVTLQYFDGIKWIHCSKWSHEHIAWLSLGSDNFNYRTVDSNGNVLTDKSKPINYKIYIYRKHGLKHIAENQEDAWKAILDRCEVLGLSKPKLENIEWLEDIKQL